MARGTDTFDEELVHGAVAQAAVVGVAEVADFAFDISDKFTEVGLLVAVVVKVVDETFEVVDHTESRSNMEVHMPVGKDDHIGCQLSYISVVDEKG